MPGQPCLDCARSLSQGRGLGWRQHISCRRPTGTSHTSGTSHGRHGALYSAARLPGTLHGVRVGTCAGGGQQAHGHVMPPRQWGHAHGQATVSPVKGGWGSGVGQIQWGGEEMGTGYRGSGSESRLLPVRIVRVMDGVHAPARPCCPHVGQWANAMGLSVDGVEHPTQ